MFRQIFQYVNYSFKRKMIVVFSTVFALLLIFTFWILYLVVSREFTDRIINDTQMILDTARDNIDYYFNDMKAPLVTIGRSPTVADLVSMKEEETVFSERLSKERELMDLMNNFNSFKTYMGDLIVLGENGYMKNLISGLNTDFVLSSKEWAIECHDFSERGIHYFMPHEVDYYKRNPYPSAVSAIFPIYKGHVAEGYIMCDISAQRIDAILDNFDFADGTKVYLMDQNGQKIYLHGESTMDNILSAYMTETISCGAKGSFQGGDELITYTTLQSNGWKIISISPYSQILSSVRPMLQICMIAVMVSLILSVIVSVALVRYIEKPLDQLVSRIGQVESNDFRPVFEKGQQYHEVAVIRNRFEQMVSSMNELINKNYLLELRRKEVEYDNLSNQINPHFLYNVLQLIQTEAILAENEQIEEIVVSLSYLMRYALDNRDKLVRLRQEYEYTKYFLELYHKRYEKMFIYRINIQEELMEKTVLKFILQPLVENCIKHGFRDKKAGGLIEITAQEIEDVVHITVYDNGCGMSCGKLQDIRTHMEQPAVGSSVGLANTNQRIKLQYGEGYGLMIHSEEGKFTRITCTFPSEDWGK